MRGLSIPKGQGAGESNGVQCSVLCGAGCVSSRGDLIERHAHGSHTHTAHTQMPSSQNAQISTRISLQTRKRLILSENGGHSPSSPAQEASIDGGLDQIG